MRYLKIRIILLGFVLIVLKLPHIYGQAFPQLRFETLTTEDGLSGNEVTCFSKDKDGFLWVGTKNGLNRFDGNQFLVFKNNPENSNSISGNHIVQILQDSTGIFWIATKNGGLTRYDPNAPASKQFHQFIHNPNDKNSIATNRLNCLYDYNKDYLLIGAEEYPGIFVNKKTFSFSYYNWPSKYFSPQNATVFPDGKQRWLHQISEGPGKNLLLTFHTPAQVFAISKDPNIPFRDTFMHGVSGSISCFYPDGDTIWLGGWSNGLYFQLMKTTLKREYISENQGLFLSTDDYITAICGYNSNYLLVATKSKGIFLVDKITGTKKNLLQIKGDEQSLSSNKVNCIYNDQKGVFWIGTEKGISKLNTIAKKFKIDLISHPMLDGDLTIFSMHEDKEQTLRVCTSQGIFARPKNKEDFTYVPVKFRNRLLSVTTIAESLDGNYLLGTESYFYSYNLKSEQIAPLPIFFENETITIYDYALNQVRTILYDSISHQPGLWIGLLGDGVNYIDLSANKIYSVTKSKEDKNSIGNNLVRRMLLDHNRNLWVATSGGLFCLNKKTIPLENDFTSHLSVPNDTTTLSCNDIRDIIEDGNHQLWLATNGGGLNMFDGKRFHQFKGASSSAMFSLVFDDKNRLWIATADGIEVFIPALKKFYPINLNSGRDYFGNPSTFLKKQDGTLCIGSGNQLITFMPDSVLTKFSFPKIYISDIEVMNQKSTDLLSQTNFTLPYNKNFISFHFSSLNLSNQVETRYQYKLVGLNENWITAGVEGKAIYTSLPPNHYTFLIKSTNAIGEWSRESQLVSFTINPPFWLTWWFMLICILLLGYIVFFIFRYRLKELKRIQRIRNQIANDLHDDVGSALSTISLYTEVARMKNTSQNGISEVLEKIALTSQDMQENMSHIVWSLQPRNDQFDKVLLKMKNYSIEVLGSKEVPVIFHASDDLLSIKMKGQNRRELFLIFKEAINNISKYSKCNQVEISLKRSGKNLEMEIRDDGKGFNANEVLMGNGLQSMKERAGILSGKFEVHSFPEKGTTVHLVFPI